MDIHCISAIISDEPEQSWLELKTFQLNLARDLLHFSSELKIDWKTSLKFNSQLKTYFL